MKNSNWKTNKYYKKFDENRDLIIKLNKSGLNIKQIAEVVDIPHRRLGDLIRFEKLPIKKAFTYNINDDFFDNLDSELKLYLLGYFLADGCMIHEDKKRNGVVYSHSYRFCFSVSEDDLDVMELFQKHVCNNKPFEHSNCQTGVKYKRKPQIKYRWTSEHMFQTLTSYGITPNKTLNDKFKLPEEITSSKFFPDFIRGLIDGDGHIGVSSIDICLNSPLLADQIQLFFKKFKYCTGFRLTENQGKTCKWWNLTIKGGQKLLSEYYDKCYHNTNFCLKRKRNNVEVNARLRKGVASPQSIEGE